MQSEPAVLPVLPRFDFFDHLIGHVRIQSRRHAGVTSTDFVKVPLPFRHAKGFITFHVDRHSVRFAWTCQESNVFCSGKDFSCTPTTPPRISRIPAVQSRLHGEYRESRLYTHDSATNVENPRRTLKTPSCKSRIPAVQLSFDLFTHRLYTPASGLPSTRETEWLDRFQQSEFDELDCVAFCPDFCESKRKQQHCLRIVVPALLTCKAAALEPPRRFAPPLLTQEGSTVSSRLRSEGVSPGRADV